MVSQDHSLRGSSWAGKKDRHRFVVPEGCRSWCCGTTLHGRLLCLPTDSSHLEVFHTAWSKIHTFSTITSTHSFIWPKAKTGRSHTCTVGNAHWSLMCNCYLPFCGPIIELLRIISTHAIFLTLFSTNSGWGSLKPCVVYSCNLIISTVFSGLIYCSVHPSTVLNQGVFIYSLSFQLSCYYGLRIFHKHQLIFTTLLWNKA